VENRAELIYLLERYRKRACSQDEVVRLLTIIKSSHDEDFRELFESENEREEIIQARDVSAEKRARMEGIFRQIERKRKSAETTVRLRRVLPYAAAVIMLIAGYWLYSSLNPHVKHKNTETELVSRFGDDIAPGSQQATLTLPDGRTINLKGVQKEVVADSNKLSYAGGQLISELKGNDGEILLSTPKGGRYEVTLPDGTKVYLNSASSLHYNSDFNKKERIVTVEGEAYFEVAQNKNRPFIVKSRGQAIRVLGTAFNINAYKDEPVVSTTLVAGKVKVSREEGTQSVLLQPGQQSRLGEKQLNIKTVDTETVISWKNNVFDFQNATLREVMRQLSRWYNVEVDMESLPKETFYATIPRDVKLSAVLAALEETGRLRFKIQGRRLMVERQ